MPRTCPSTGVGQSDVMFESFNDSDSFLNYIFSRRYLISK